ncbi:hypothetical protein [Kibdelosporangium aridum]|uniref:hypothetical protein n=1 Tax=Kibdelosporangium aridum TaxID=2030 RepID=UPI0005263AAA
MRALKRILLALASWVVVTGCGPDVPAVSQADTLRAYQPHFVEVRRKLLQVKSLLPAARVGSASCAVPAPLNPKFMYTTEYDVRTGQSANNVEIISERALTDPDTQVKYMDAFEYDPTQLIEALRWTGPHGPLGDNQIELLPPAATWNEDDDRKLRTKLDIGLNTRYALVLRTIEYTPPQRIDEPTRKEFYSRIEADAFVVDLHQVALLCSFTADAEYSDFAVLYNNRTSWSATMYENMAGSLGYQIIKHLEQLTGGTVGKPK